MNKIIFVFAFVLFNSCGQSESDNQKIVFMDNFMVFESFLMKKDYDKIIEGDLKEEAKLIDSISKKMNATTNPAEIAKLSKDKEMAEYVFNQKFEELSRTYTEKVSNRLNELVDSYSKEKGYDIVLGTSGQGSLMFVKDEIDISEDVLKYINTKYKK